MQIKDKSYKYFRDLLLEQSIIEQKKYCRNKCSKACAAIKVISFDDWTKAKETNISLQLDSVSLVTHAFDCRKLQLTMGCEQRSTSVVSDKPKWIMFLYI